MFNKVKIHSRIESSSVMEVKLSSSVAKDVAFHMTDWLNDLAAYVENMAVIRHIALNLLSHDKTKKGGIHAKRLTAGWDTNYLEKLLTQSLDSSKL